MNLETTMEVTDTMNVFFLQGFFHGLYEDQRIVTSGDSLVTYTVSVQSVSSSSLVNVAVPCQQRLSSWCSLTPGKEPLLAGKCCCCFSGCLSFFVPPRSWFSLI